LEATAKLSAICEAPALGEEGQAGGFTTIAQNVLTPEGGLGRLFPRIAILSASGMTLMREDKTQAYKRAQ